MVFHANVGRTVLTQTFPKTQIPLFLGEFHPMPLLHPEVSEGTQIHEEWLPFTAGVISQIC